MPALPHSLVRGAYLPGTSLSSMIPSPRWTYGLRTNGRDMGSKGMMSSFWTTRRTLSCAAASLVSRGLSLGAPNVTTLPTSIPAVLYRSPTATATAPPREWPVSWMV